MAQFKAQAEVEVELGGVRWGGRSLARFRWVNQGGAMLASLREVIKVEHGRVMFSKIE